MSSPEDWAIEPLTQRHVRDSFDCGESKLVEFLKRLARQHQDRGISRTSVITRGADPRVLGYATLTGRTLDAKRFPPEEARRFRYPVPVVLLARLAADRTVQGQGVGEMLLASALKKAVQAADLLGFFAVEVEAKSAEVKRFYEKHGFRALPDDALHLYIPIATVRRIGDSKGPRDAPSAGGRRDPGRSEPQDAGRRCNIGRLMGRRRGGSIPLADSFGASHERTAPTTPNRTGIIIVIP